MKVKDYDHFEHELELDFLDDVDSEKEKKIIEEVEKIVQKYRKGIDAKDYEIVIPLGKILSIKIDGEELNDAEIDIAYNYIEKQGYGIRGNDSTAENELECYSRYAVNKMLLTNETKPYSRKTQARKLKKLAKYYEIIKMYESLDLENIDDYGMLETYKQLLEKYYELRNDLIIHNLQLARPLIRDLYKKYDLPEDDKYSLAFIQIMRALDYYVKQYNEKAKYCQLSTYIFNTKQNRHYFDETRMIKLPAHISETVEKIQRIIDDLYFKLEHEPDLEEIGNVVGLPSKRVKELLQISYDSVSIDALLEEEQEIYFEEGYYDEGVMKDWLSIEDEIKDLNNSESEDPFEIASNSMLKSDIEKILAELNPRQQTIINLRFGLLDNIPRTFKEIEKFTGLTQEEIMKIESSAITIIRNKKHTKKLKRYLH